MDQNTLTYHWDDPSTGSGQGISEWWINQPGGLEQGFTLQERPQSLNRNTQSPLVLEMAVTGTLTPVQHGDTIHFQNAEGTTILTYDKLHVFDAEGVTIPATFNLQPATNTLQILVEDAAAAYPLTIDPWVETAILRASDARANDEFGWSVSVSGDRLVVGAPFEDGGAGNPASSSGAAYVFERDGAGTWSEIAILRASDAQADDYFGISVSISGDRLVVGAYEEDGGTGDPVQNSGAAYVFERNGAGTWSETAILRASDAQERDYFG